MNHLAVPSCWILHAVLWLIEGSGGESHVRKFCPSWVPVCVFQPWRPIAEELTNVWARTTLLETQNRKKVCTCMTTSRKNCVHSKLFATTIKFSSLVSASNREIASSMSLLPATLRIHLRILLIRPSVITLVESARIESICAMIFASNSVNSFENRFLM